MRTISKRRVLVKKVLLASVLSSVSVAAPTYAGKDGNTFYGDFRLRYENVAQDNPLEDADALTLRSRLGFKTKKVNGFSGLLEVENNTALIDDYSVPPTGDRVGEFSVIADPETTEIDQAFISYNSEKFSAKVGRQVFVLDGHRFVGHVGWRQDRQTFDAAVFTYKPQDGIQLNFTYIDKRNRIFADERDIDSEDIIVNSAFKTSVGKVVAYAYLLEMDVAANNGLDTYGVNLKGSTKFGENSFLYNLEYASQEANDTFDTDFILVEGGIKTFGITAKVGLEVLGSDNGQFGFATPLATLHKFNGWSDQFLRTPDQGLEDLYASISGKIFGGKWVASYHDFSTDTSLSGQDDLGAEVNLLYTRKFGDSFSGGLKFADYDAGDAVFGKVDTRKTWVWAGFKF